MTKKPMNIILSFCVGAMLWLIFGVFVASWYSEQVSLAVSAVEVFSLRLQIFLGIAVLGPLVLLVFWFLYGSTDISASEPETAKKKWYQYFAASLALCVLLVIGFIIMHVPDQLAAADYLLALVFFSISSFFYFWLCSFLFSPINVKYAVLFRK